MKRKWMKLASGLLVFVMLAGAVTGCGSGKGDSNSKNTLTIRVSNTGYGVEAITAIANEFAKIEGCEVKVESTVTIDSDLSKLNNDYLMEDVWFVSGTFDALDTIRLGKFVAIDDVMDSIPEGETTAVKDKLFPEFKDGVYLNSDGHYYSMPYETQLGGFAYNKSTLDDLFGVGNWSVPQTSDELERMANEVKAKNAWAFTYTTSQPYWEMAVNTWQVQYMGIDAYTQIAKGYYQDANGEWKFSQNAEAVEQNIGMLRTYEAVYKLMNKDFGLASSYCSSMDFAQSQASFAGLGYKPADEKKVAFAPNGAWLYEENFEDFNYSGSDVGFFNVVMSAVVEKLSFWQDGATSYYELSDVKRATYDGALSLIIDYVRGESEQQPTQYEGLTITENDIAAVKEMDSLRYVNDQPHAAIAANSKNIELAKKFLTFYASDYAGRIYSSTCHGVTPFCYNQRTVDENTVLWDKDVNTLLSGEIKVMPSISGLVMGKLYRPSMEQCFFDATAKENMNTPAKAFDAGYVGQNRSAWKKYVVQAGCGDLLEE